jgi:hypothetical protein
MLTDVRCCLDLIPFELKLAFIQIQISRTML